MDAQTSAKNTGVFELGPCGPSAPTSSSSSRVEGFRPMSTNHTPKVRSLLDGKAPSPIDTPAVEHASRQAPIVDDDAANSFSMEEGRSNNISGRRGLFLKYRPLVLLAIWMVMTAWWITGLILHRHDLGWLIPSLLWLAISVRFLTLYISTKYVTRSIALLWITSMYNPSRRIPRKLRLPLGAAGTIAVFLVGTFTTPESHDNTNKDRAISLFGLLVFICLLYATSHNRKAIKWQTVIVGMLAQYILALFVLRAKAGYDIFKFISYLAESLLGFSTLGATFVTATAAVQTHYFIITVVPAVVFFISFVQLLFYWGWLQWAIRKFAAVFFYSMGVSGAETVVAAASPFVGMGESAILIKPFLPHLTISELHQIMTSGFATIAGTVLGVYIGLGASPVALVSSCVMSIPASLAISKLRWPETEESLTGRSMVIPEDTDEKPVNSIHAFGNGAWIGIKVAGMIIAALLCIISLLGLVDALLGWWGHYLNIHDLTIETICSYLLYPVAFLLGVERNGDLLKVSKLIGMKIIANEFVAYTALNDPNGEYVTLSNRSRLIATYALCGFGNIGSVGIQIGVLSQLAPHQSGRVAKVAISALISGIISTLTSASIAGMLITDSTSYTKSAGITA
ncbi:hypothetical protein EG329_005205 [Mollisiaceae sp. DMI_Dod_QoI]|nr:hypothetical protein EG329_005205 [Helotiales sp. DMI_Dod_QoI]